MQYTPPPPARRGDLNQIDMCFARTSKVYNVTKPYESASLPDVEVVQSVLSLSPKGGDEVHLQSPYCGHIYIPCNCFYMLKNDKINIF